MLEPKTQRLFPESVWISDGMTWQPVFSQRHLVKRDSDRTNAEDTTQQLPPAPVFLLLVCAFGIVCGVAAWLAGG